MRHFLSLTEVGPDNLAELVRASLKIASGRNGDARPLSGKIVGLYFRGTSTRTRTAFTVGAMRLGAGVVTYGPNDLQIATGETVWDTGRVLSGFIDALVVRTNGSAGEMSDPAAQDCMAVINAMSEDEHPTQAIADLVTISEALGSLRGVHVLYVGEGNNSAAALALAVANDPRDAADCSSTPEGTDWPHATLAAADEFARATAAAVDQHHDIARRGLAGSTPCTPPAGRRWACPRQTPTEGRNSTLFSCHLRS